MPDQEEHYDAVLAEIILSKRVGLSHFRLVGEIIVARAQLSELLLGRTGLSFDQRVDLVEEVIALEDAYRDAWRRVSSDSYAQNRMEYLAALEQALRAAAEGISSIARRLGGDS